LKAQTALLIGNSDGIGLAMTRALLQQGWHATGISRSESPLSDSYYKHIKQDISNAEYQSILNAVLSDNGPVSLCIFCAAIGELLDLTNMSAETSVFEVNLMALIKTVAAVIPVMVENGRGHFIGLSSVADELLSPEAPSYHASKAGFSNYLEGLSLALKPKGISVTNVRFGFVDTKMAKGDRKPFMMSVERAVRHMKTVIDKKPIRYTAPPVLIPLVRLRGWMYRLKT